MAKRDNSIRILQAENQRLQNDVLRLKSGHLGRQITPDMMAPDNTPPYNELLQEIQNAFYKKQPFLGRNQRELEQVRNSVDMVRSTFDYNNSRKAVMELGRDMEVAIRELLNSRPLSGSRVEASPERLSRTFLDQSNVQKPTEEEERIEIINGVPTKVRIIRRTPERASPSKVVLPPTQVAYERVQTQPPAQIARQPESAPPSPALQTELIMLQQKNRELETKLARAIEDLNQREKSRSDVMRLNTIYDKQTIEIDDLKRQVSMLLAKLNERDSNRSKNVAENEKAKEEAREEIKRLREQLIELTHKSREELHVLQVQLRGKDATIQDLEDKLHSKTAEAEDNGSRLLQREAELKDAQRQMTSEMYRQIEAANRAVMLEDSEKEWRERADRAEDKAFQMESEAKMLQARVHELESRVREAAVGDPVKDGRIWQLEAQVAALRKELQETKARLDKAEREHQAEKLRLLSEFDSNMKQQERSITSRYEDQIRELQRQLKNEKLEQQTLLDKLSQAQKSFEQVDAAHKKRITELENELRALQAKYADKQSADISQLMKEHADKIQKIEKENQEEKRKLLEKLKSLEEETKANNLAALEPIRKAQSENELLRSKLRDLEAALNQKPKDSDKAEKLSTEVEDLRNKIKNLERNEADLIDELADARAALKTVQYANINTPRDSVKMTPSQYDELVRLRRQLRSLKDDYVQLLEASDATQETMRVYIQSLRTMFNKQLECYPVGTVPNLLDKLRKAEKDLQESRSREAPRDSNQKQSQRTQSPMRPDRNGQKHQVIDTYYDPETGKNFCAECIQRSDHKKAVRFEGASERDQAYINELKEHVEALQDELKKRDMAIENLRRGNQSPPHYQ